MPYMTGNSTPTLFSPHIPLPGYPDTMMRCEDGRQHTKPNTMLESCKTQQAKWVGIHQFLAIFGATYLWDGRHAQISAASPRNLVRYRKSGRAQDWISSGAQRRCSHDQLVYLHRTLLSTVLLQWPLTVGCGPAKVIRFQIRWCDDGIHNSSSISSSTSRSLLYAYVLYKYYCCMYVCYSAFVLQAKWKVRGK